MRDSSGKNLPLILHPHGGPHGPRDEWGFNPEVQFLANRGYAALQTVVREPAKYQCTIGYVGVYDLPLMFKDGDIPQSDWGRNYLRKVLPDSLGEQQAQSPAFNIDKIRIPVMLVHGKKDERVPMSQYDRLHDGLVKAGRPPEMIVLEDKEGHGFYDFQNQVDLYTKMEAFLDKHIGGAGNAQAGR